MGRVGVRVCMYVCWGEERQLASFLKYASAIFELQVQVCVYMPVCKGRMSFEFMGMCVCAWGLQVCLCGCCARGSRWPTCPSLSPSTGTGLEWAATTNPLPPSPPAAGPAGERGARQPAAAAAGADGGAPALLRQAAGERQDPVGGWVGPRNKSEHNWNDKGPVGGRRVGQEWSNESVLAGEREEQSGALFLHAGQVAEECCTTCHVHHPGWVRVA